MYRVANLGTNQQFFWDDMYVNTGATFLGDVRVETLYPNVDSSTYAQWSFSTGSTGYTLIDETTPNDDTDYIKTDVAGYYSTFGTTDLSSTTAAVKAVQTNIYARKTTGGTRTLRPIMLQSGTTKEGATTGGLSTSYSTYSEIFETDPIGSTWTATNVNADEFGVKVQS